MKTYGAIDLRDYEAVVRGRRRRKWTRVAGIAAIVGICIFCVAAGNYFRPWTGRSKDIETFEHAVAMMRNTPAADASAVNAGMGKAMRAIPEAVDLLREIAGRDNESGLFATAYLQNLSRRVVGHLIAIEDEGLHTEQAVKALDHLAEMLKTR